jgi:multidrug efflux pump subunit AcrB
MVIQTRWPGATQDETLKQVTDRIEKNSKSSIPSTT